MYRDVRDLMVSAYRRDRAISGVAAPAPRGPGSLVSGGPARVLVLVLGIKLLASEIVFNIVVTGSIVCGWMTFERNKEVTWGDTDALRMLERVAGMWPKQKRK